MKEEALNAWIALEVPYPIWFIETRESDSEGFAKSRASAPKTSTEEFFITFDLVKPLRTPLSRVRR